MSPEKKYAEDQVRNFRNRRKRGKGVCHFFDVMNKPREVQGPPYRDEQTGKMMAGKINMKLSYPLKLQSGFWLIRQGAE
jgi:pyruvate/oxaloacetate carboxyltransferase